MKPISIVCGLLAVTTDRFHASVLAVVGASVAVALMACGLRNSNDPNVIGANIGAGLFIFFGLPCAIGSAAVSVVGLTQLSSRRPSVDATQGWRTRGAMATATVLIALMIAGTVVLFTPSADAALCPSPAWSYAATDSVAASLQRAGATAIVIDVVDCDISDTSWVRAHGEQARAIAQLRTDGWALAAGGSLIRTVSDASTAVRVGVGRAPGTLEIRIAPAG